MTWSLLSRLSRSSNEPFTERPLDTQKVLESIWVELAALSNFGSGFSASKPRQAA